jgi:Ca2+-transporting ATPase
MKKEEGLSTRESHIKLQQYGYNEIKDMRVVSPLKILVRQVKKNYVLYLLFFAAIASFFLGKAITGYVIIADIILIILVGFIQEYRAEKVMKSLMGLLVPISIVLRDGKEKEIPSREIVPGDILLLRSGEKVPADCIVLEEKELLVNESILTGESKEIEKEAVKDAREYLEGNMLFMGSFIINGRCAAKVAHTGMNTKFGEIAGMISAAEKDFPLQTKVNKITKNMVIVAIVFAILTGLLIIIGKPFSKTLLIEVLILIVALCVSSFPEGFPVVLMTALSAGIRRMAQKNAIVNRMSVIEALGETTVICSDKTGTITKGEMTIEKIFSDNKIIEVSGTGYAANGIFTINKNKINPKEEYVLDLLNKAAVMCNDSRIERTGEDNMYNIFGTPTEASLLIMAAKAGIFKEDIKFTRVEEIPFNSNRKIMSVLCRFENKDYVYTKGAPEILLEKCKFIQRNNGIFTLTDQEKKKILAVNKKMTSNSLRTLCLAYKKIGTFEKDHFEKNLIFLGIVAMEDPPRDEVRESIMMCKKAGIKVKMITGDNKETAMAIAKEIGLNGRVLEGSDLDKMNEEELSKIVQEVVVFSRVRPEHKLKIVKALKLNGEIVTMTGDGVNDAPALKEAHIGVAMGKGGTDVSRSVADLTLKDNNFSTIVVAVKEGRTVFKNIRKFVSYQLSVSYAEISVWFFSIILASFFGWAVPILLALQILFMNIVTSDIPAITLSLNRSSADIMTEKPRKKKEILNKDLIYWMIICSAFMAFFTLLSYFISFNILGEAAEYARTTALLSLIFIEIAHAFSFRSFRKKVKFTNFFRNKWLCYASLISVAATVLIIYTPLNKIFGTVPVGIHDWLIAIVFAFLMIIILNILKDINNKKKLFKLENF